MKPTCNCAVDAGIPPALVLSVACGNEAVFRGGPGIEHRLFCAECATEQRRYDAKNSRPPTAFVPIGETCDYVHHGQDHPNGRCGKPSRGSLNGTHFCLDHQQACYDAFEAAQDGVAAPAWNSAKMMGALFVVVVVGIIVGILVKAFIL